MNSSAILWRDEDFIIHEPGWGLLDLYFFNRERCILTEGAKTLTVNFQ